MSKNMKWGNFNLVKREQINAYLFSDSHKIDKRKCLELSPSQVSLTDISVHVIEEGERLKTNEEKTSFL